jgi:uncharacterized membrane protein
MNISVKISKALHIGGIVMAGCFVLAIIAGLLKLSYAPILAAIGVAITAATPVAGVVVAGIYLYKNGEKKYFIYTMLLLLMMLLASVWRLKS